MQLCLSKQPCSLLNRPETCRWVCSVHRLKAARPLPTHSALYDPIFTSLESTCWRSLWYFVFIPTLLVITSAFPPKIFLRRGKINQWTPINTVKVDRKYKQHICCRNQSWVVKACSVKAQMLPFLSCLTLFRTMQSAASAGKGYRIVSFFSFWTQWSRANAATSNEARCGCAIAAQGGDYWFSDYGYCRGVEWMANSSLSLTAMAAGT